jgi:hypothetical protein
VCGQISTINSILRNYKYISRRYLVKVSRRPHLIVDRRSKKVLVIGREGHLHSAKSLIVGFRTGKHLRDKVDSSSDYDMKALSKRGNGGTEMESTRRNTHTIYVYMLRGVTMTWPASECMRWIGCR